MKTEEGGMRPFGGDDSEWLVSRERLEVIRNSIPPKDSEPVTSWACGAPQAVRPKVPMRKSACRSGSDQVGPYPIRNSGDVDGGAPSVMVIARPRRSFPQASHRTQQVIGQWEKKMSPFTLDPCAVVSRANRLPDAPRACVG